MQQVGSTRVHASGIHGGHPPNDAIKTLKPFHPFIDNIELLKRGVVEMPSVLTLNYTIYVLQ